ncbi:MBL fold metallo-hydrolase [Brevibacillus sp. SYP-B805]|uniref:ComEC/Rec2 family competence protein n=1 Tax=Brevibacillus sp. SYP-B805 TaxID=1578199 RepID=UPI0013EA051D|nr:MBL fold metallo-hydrolase [Brevibacillus sp. SYP-B805]NGQ94531.1 MBL fold metallo-hydrolase [Brevibacillus sp. SYP-B805]
MRRIINLLLRLSVVSLFLLAGCGIDSHLQHAVKVEDPFSAEDDQSFTGMVLYYFSLPNGESTLVRFPSGKTLLIDTGAAEDGKTLLALLAERRVTKLDYVLLSNDQPEQAGGYPYLASSLQIDTILMPKLIEPSIRRVVPVKSDKKLVLLSEGDVLQLENKIALHVLHPSEYLFLSPQDNSLVFQLKQENMRFLFTSAIGEKAEERLIQKHGKELRAEVLKVAAQGSNQASSQPFLSLVDPQVAIVQTGIPRTEMKAGQDEIIERLGESWAETYITSQDGTIMILSNGKDYRVIKQKVRR